MLSYSQSVGDVFLDACVVTTILILRQTRHLQHDCFLCHYMRTNLGSKRRPQRRRSRSIKASNIALFVESDRYVKAVCHLACTQAGFESEVPERILAVQLLVELLLLR